MIINIDKPLYEMTGLTGYINQILSYDTDKCVFVVKYMHKNTVKEISSALNANLLSFRLNGPWGFDPVIVDYLLSKGVDRIAQVPDQFNRVLSKEKIDKDLKELIFKLLQIKSGVYHLELHDPDPDDGFLFINDEELQDLSAKALILDGAINWLHITELKKFGFRVFPLQSDSDGWILGGLDTGKGIVAFG